MIHCFGDYVLDCQQRELRFGKGIVPLEPQVFDLLALLVERRHVVVTRDELIEAVWAGRVVSNAAIDSRISTARRALGDNGSDQALIRTVPRRGFRFIGKVVTEPEVQRYPQPPLPDLPSIAVLPFENLSGAPRIGLMADALVEDVTAMLARVGGFFVVASRSAFAYREQPVDLRTIGRQLGVRHLVTGSVRGSGDRVMITVSLVDAETGLQRWAGRLDASPEDVVDLQTDLARSVISEIEPALNTAELEIIRRCKADDLDAWAHYRSAVATLAVGGWTEGTVTEARRHLQQAVQRDPGFARGYAHSAMIAALARGLGALASTEPLLAEIRGLVDTAIELDPNDSEVLSFAGCALNDIGDVVASGEVTERALRIDPSNAHALIVRGFYLALHGYMDEGLAAFRRGMRLSPRDRRLGAWGTGLAGCLLRAGQPVQALEEARLAYLRDRNLFMAKLIEALAAHDLGRCEDAEAALSVARRTNPRLTVWVVEHFLGGEAAARFKRIWPLEGRIAVAAGP
ncbi:MAG: transcriptional regulator [Reyranella sp.]|uniref:winged helix-turn-helix domain-containing tetratricopeptide repeat protein n=1 Tax=Reyranella sp. TaxID=1929291 RepID=UPI00121BE7DF|nr:winged helix-turn-helix domain-containing protein [Reyranella sp.]TAJ35709.1 MAG: transcriptional regulator [Reyranella sp.]